MAWAVLVNGELVAVTTLRKDAEAMRDSYQTTDKQAATIQPYPA